MMSTPQSLINFYVPTHLRDKFDVLCRYKGQNRSSQLNHFIEEWVTIEEKSLQTTLDGDKLTSVLQRFVDKQSKPSPKVSVQPPPQKKVRRWEESYIDDPFDNGVPF